VAEVPGTNEIKFWIMSYGSNALVLEPESLRKEIRTEVEGLLNRYEKEGEKEEKNDFRLSSGSLELSEA